MAEEMCTMMEVHVLRCGGRRPDRRSVAAFRDGIVTGEVMTDDMGNIVRSRQTPGGEWPDAGYWFRSLVESINEVFWLASADRRRFQYVSPAFRQIWGKHSSDAEVVAKLWRQAVLSEDRPVLSRALRSVARRGHYDIEYRIRRPDGDVRWLRERAILVRNGTGVALHLAGVTDDISATRQSAENLLRLNRALRLLGACNRVVMHAASEQEMFESICREIVDTGGYRLAWIGRAGEAPERRVWPVARYGTGDDYVDRIHVSYGDEEIGRGPTGSSIRTGQTHINQNCLANPSMSPWRTEAIRQGYLASIALPVRDEIGVFGALTIYASQPDAFNEEEVRLLEELVENLDFALAALHARRQRQEAEHRLRLAAQVYQSSSESMLVMNGRWQVLDVNPAFVELTGYALVEVIGRDPDFLLAEPQEQTQDDVFWRTVRRQVQQSGAWEGEALARSRSGKLLPLWLNISRIPGEDGDDAAEPRFVVFHHDLTEKKQFDQQLWRQANFDLLTGLPNRNLLQDRTAQAISQVARHDGMIAVMVLNLDGFRMINDSFGYAAGDLMLREIAQRLTAGVRREDTVARLGSDEFVVLMTEVSDDGNVSFITEQLRSALAQPFMIDERELFITTGIGIALYPRDGDDVSTLLRNADAALRQARESGCNSFQFYDPELNEAALGTLMLENNLRYALERNELLLHYQPLVNLRSGRMTGVEALMRWNHPKLGMIPPTRFIPVAEKSGQIVEIGRWVLRQACAQAAAWRAQGHEVVVAVNLSALQFRNAALVDEVAGILAETGLAAEGLELELTEGVLIRQPELVLDVLTALRKIGVRLSIDDFGTGYSSLAYLKRFPVNKVKIDRTFVADIVTDPNDNAIVSAIIAMAHSLKLSVIAEGVETIGQLAFLVMHECDEIQGYYYARPLPADEIDVLLAQPRLLQLPEVAPGNVPTLLLLDDEANILRALERVFRREGYRVLSTTSAIEALHLLAGNEIGVVVADQRMPEMNGVEFLRRVKQLHPDSIRIVLSGYTDLKSVTAAINEGAVYKFLTKPWDDTQLQDNIREAFALYAMKRDHARLVRELTLANERLQSGQGAM